MIGFLLYSFIGVSLSLAFYGQGLAELLCGRQLNINSLYRFIRRGHELTIVPRVFVDTSNSLIKSQLTNEIGTIIPTRGGKAPTFYTPQAFTSELYNWLNTLERGGFDEAGISMMSAANQLPQGIESAPAQREYSYKEGSALRQYHNDLRMPTQS